MHTYVTHICSRQGWEEALRQGRYQPPSLWQEGFIHLSRPEQVLVTANRFYAGVKGLVLLWIVPQKLTAPLKWEAADGDVFPHLYGALPVEAVAAVTDFSPDSDGVFRHLRVPEE